VWETARLAAADGVDADDLRNRCLEGSAKGFPSQIPRSCPVRFRTPEPPQRSPSSQPLPHDRRRQLGPRSRVEVASRGLEVCVAEEFLDGTDVDPVVDEVGGEGVARAMTALLAFSGRARVARTVAANGAPRAPVLGFRRPVGVIPRLAAVRGVVAAWAALRAPARRRWDCPSGSAVTHGPRPLPTSIAWTTLRVAAGGAVSSERRKA
jgi:hypothetical protein